MYISNKLVFHLISLHSFMTRYHAGQWFVSRYMHRLPPSVVKETLQHPTEQRLKRWIPHGR